MARTRVVLNRPERPENIGAVARVIANTGLDGLDLIAPGDWRTVESWRMAWRAEEFLEQARVFDTLDEALGDAVYVAGFAGRTGMRVEPITPREMADEIASLDPEAPVGLVFGRESTGLTEKELSRCQRRVSIPSHPRQPSLNLAQSVMVAGYELFVTELTGLTKAKDETPGRQERAPYKHVERALVSLEEAFLEIRFLTPDNRAPRFAEWRELFGRAGLTPREVKLVLALARKLRNVGRIANAN